MKISTRYYIGMDTIGHIRTLISRLARLEGAETWGDALNPAQIAALEYLSRANRFSRAPSHVAEYLGTTRGTMSQTLKALMRKGYVSETRSDADKRSIRYDLTAEGSAVLARSTALANAIEALPERDRLMLSESLSTLLGTAVTARGGRAFGVCATCAFHRAAEHGAFCALLSVRLATEETDQICHEHEAA